MHTDAQKMGRKVNLGHLDDAECEKILQVLQKDFELREKERERLSKIEETVKEEENKAEILAKKTKLNENVCINCCQTFGVIFNRKQTCQSCKLFSCKSCCVYDDVNKGYVCRICIKEKELKLKSCDWFYNNVSKRFKRFGSAKIVRSLYKEKSSRSRLYHTDNESDSGYDPSVLSSLKYGSTQSLNRIRHDEPFPAPVDSESELDPALQTSTHKPLPKASSLESLAHKAFNIKSTDNEDDKKTTKTRDIYKEAFESTKEKEEKRFRDRFENLLSELQHSLENQSPNGMTAYGSTSYGEVIVNYRNKLRELLASHSQKLQLAIESFDSNLDDSDTATSAKVKHLVSRLVEDSLGESIDLTSDEAVSDLSSLSDDSAEHHKSFEDQLAQVIVSKVIENQRKENRLGLTFSEIEQLNSCDNVDSRLTGKNSSISEEKSEAEKSDSATSDVDQEFQKLRDFAQDILSPRPTTQEHKVEEILEESPIEKTTVRKEESSYDFDTRLSSFERVHDSHIPLPDFTQEDFEFSTNEIDPDLLSMNLAPILEEDEEGYEEEENNNATPKDRSWKENWIFKGASNISPYDNLGKKRVGGELGEMYMMIPNPEKDYSPQVGNRDADQLSDLSEAEDKDEDNLSDEESSFYAKTSEELARITRKSSATQSSVHALASSSVQTEESELDTSKDCASSVSESGVKGQGLLSEKSDSSADESSIKKKLVEDLVPAEGDDPKFEIPPESVTVPEGEPVKFYCRVGGTTPVDIFWYKVSPSHELQELEDSEQFDLLRESNRYTITMYNPRKSDAGQYMCMAINEKGQCCQYIILTVKKNTQELKKPEFLKDIKDLEVKEGQSVKFRCKVKGYPQPRIVWYKDRKKLNSDHNVKIEKFGNRDYILTIDCATMDEDAEYSVVAKNIAGEVKSVAQLIVEPDQSDEVVPTKSPLISNSILMKKESPNLHKDDQQLSNLGKKMFMTKDSVTEVAEEMLHTADELSDLHKSLDEMDTMLSSFEQDINTTNTSTTTTDSNTWTDSVLSHNLDRNTIQNYKNMKHAAENVRHATTAALNIITSTENVIGSDKQEMDCLATSTPRCSEDGDTTKSDDHENNNYLLKTTGELNYSVNSDDSGTESRVQRTEFVITPSSENQIKSVHNNDLSMDVSDYSLRQNSESVINNESTTDHSNMSDINSNNNNTHKKQRWKWDINSASYPPPNDFSQEKELENAEDQIYLAAGKVFALEDRVQDLHQDVTSDSEKRKISELEDEVARTVARVHQSEKDVSTIERSVSQLHVSAPTSPRSSLWEDNSSNLSSPSLSVDSGFSSIRERPLQTVIVGTTSEEDMPESRTEVNEETGVELPSVSRLKAMFSHSKPQDDDGSLKRIHSITARSLGKEKLEQIRRNAMQNMPSTATQQEPSQLTVNLTPTPGGTKQIDQDPTQIFPENRGSLFPEEVVPSKPARQNQPIKAASSSTTESQPIKKSVTSVKTMHAPAPPVMKSVTPKVESAPVQPTFTTVTRSDTATGNMPQSQTPDNKTENKEVKKTPRIRSGCISARAAFWEKKILEEEVNEDEFPDMVEDEIPE